MESLQESTSNQEKIEDKSNDNKKEDNSLKENGVQASLPKKKFARTNFALKMKNKRKEAKLHNLDAKETLSTCKEVSIDVTRLTSNPVPKIINAVGNKNRKKKRSQWKMGIMKKKKKSLGKDAKINPLHKELVNGEGKSNHASEDIKTTENVILKNKEPIHPKTEKKREPITTNGESSLRRKCLRSTTSSISETKAFEPENKKDVKPIEEENFSCRRTQPFIGKLLTKEARDEIANRILKGETERKVETKNEMNIKDVPSENKESKAEDVNKSLSVSDKKTETHDKIDKKAEKSLKPTVMDTEEKVANQPLTRSTKTVMDTKEKVANQPSRRTTNSVVDTDGKVSNQPSRRSTNTVVDTEEKVTNQSSRRYTNTVMDTEEKVTGPLSRKSTHNVKDTNRKVVNLPSRRSKKTVMDTKEKVSNLPLKRTMNTVVDTEEKVTNQPSRRSTHNVKDTDEKVINPSSRRSSSTVKDTDEKVINDPSKRSTQSVTDSDEKVINQTLTTSASEVIEAKESVKSEEISCSRTMPFLGKTIRKLAAGVPERPIEIASSSDQSDEKSTPKDNINSLASTAVNRTELFDMDQIISSKDMDTNADSTLGIKILSVSSLKDDDSMKADFLPEKADEPASDPMVIPLKDSNIESDSSKTINLDLDASANEVKIKLNLSKSTKLEETPIKSVEGQTDSLSEKKDAIKETNKSSISIKPRRSSLRSNISAQSDSLSEEFDSKPTTLTPNDVQTLWSCQRVVPFRGKNNPFFDKSLVTAEAPNEAEAPILDEVPSTAPKISSVTSDDLTAPLEASSDRLVSKEAKQLLENTSQNEIENDVTNKEVEKVESATEPLNNTDSRSSTGSPVLNGEWKFRRKRQILSSDDEYENNEKQITKKAKVPLSSDTKTQINKKAVTPLPSPGKTICSFLSTKCTKHDHQSQTDPCLARNDAKSDVYILLTRLEDMKDPEVQGYLVKTDLVNTIKKNYRRIVVDKDINDTAKTKSDRERSISTSVQPTKEKDDIILSTIPDIAQESDSSSSFKPSQETEDTSSQSTRTSTSRSRRVTSSRASSGSPILHTKRKKQPVNYLEEFSDTDEDKHSSFKRLRSQSRGPTLRDRTKSGAQGILDRDENDMEVEEFSRVGRHNIPVDSNQEETEQDVNCSRTQGIKAVKKAQERCQSVAERKISDSQKNLARSKTPHIGLSVAQNVKVQKAGEIDKKKLEEDLVQGLKSMEETINKEMEKRGLIPPGSSKSAAEKTPSLNQVSNEQLHSTPSVSTNKSITPKKILGTPQNDIASPRSGASSTFRRTLAFQNNELLSKVTRSASELVEADRKKKMKVKDVRVQLIKIEAVCNDYKDYSAGEIELLTSKYIDMLMNSNFACDTWRVSPIKLATSYNRTVDIRGAEDDSDAESQGNEPLPFEEVQVPMDSTVDFDVTAEQNNVNECLRRKSKQSDKPESAVASLSEETSSHEMTFGAVNISEVLSQPAAVEEDVENVRTVDSNAEDETNENDDSIGPAKDSNAILVNGTEVHACSLCNKIFMQKELLQKHTEENHSSCEKSSTSTTVSLKTIEKQAPGPASSKKGKTKKLRLNNESLKCTICTELFASKELLFDHIMTHNEKDLQQAYKAAKLAKDQERGEIDTEEASEEDQAKNKKQKNKSNHRKSTDSSSTAVSGEELAVEDARAATSLVDAISQQASIMDVSVTAHSLPVTTSNKALTVCQCHVHELATEDLHIEMVLLCTACNVIYRRRDCFEVHFRTSAECRRERSNGKVTKSPKLFCSGCRCVLNSLLEMRAHLEEHAEKNCTGTVTFLCNICKVAFFGVGGIFYSHWFNHTKSPNFVASRYSFPKLSVVSVLEDVNGTVTTSKSQEGFFYIAEHVCRECRLPFSSDPDLQKHKQHPCQPLQPVVPRIEPPEKERLQMIKLICDLCKKYYVSKENFDKHCNDRNHLKTPITKFSRLPINNTEQVFVCSLCRSLSKTLDQMKEHWKRVHSPIMELYTCKTCNIVPSNDVANYTYEKFERHCRMVHKSEVITCLVYFVTARYVCGICKFGFETEKSMKDHELVHQKKMATQSLPVQNATAPLSVGTTQTATFYVADNPQADGGRLLHSVVLQYPSINGAISGPLAINQLPNQSQLQLPSQINQPHTAISNQILLPTTNVMMMPNNVAVSQDHHELRSLLQNALQGPQQPSITVPQEQQQQQQQQQCNTEKVVETIELDSRSNSPVFDSAAASTSSSSNSLTAAKKAYMTKVNPDFETILKTTTGKQENRNSTGTPNSDKIRPNRDDNSTPAEVDTLTPQPFEVVLVTDELSENSNQDKNDNLGSATDEQPQQQAPEIIETKSFLRVRSVAELQSIKIHLCSICGLSFDTLLAFEQHEKQHRAMGEVGRSTPVQMISPMVAPGGKEPNHDPHNTLMTQMKQKLSLAMSNGSNASKASTSANTRAMPNVPTNLPHQPVLPPQQQQSWYPTSSNSTSSMANINYASSQSLQPPPQQHSLLRQAMNTAPLSRTDYTTVRPPPPYPSTSNAMVASGRPSAIQLPERTTGNIPPQTKRPSGAATRIPQQSLQSYDDANNRQTGGTVTYNTAPQQQPIQKTYGPVPHTVNYSTVNTTVNYQSVPQSLPRQLPPQKNIIYTCKHPNCFYRSASLAGIRAHETVHLLPQQGQQSQQLPTTSSNHQQQQQMQLQQQQQPPRLLPVSQMPERTRHAVPTSRPPGVSNSSDKRITCRICNLNCATSIELIEHVSTVHSGANQVCCYVCDYCPSPLIFDTEDQLRKHMNVSHNHSCELCNKRYPSKEDLMLHMEVHMRRA